ATADRRGAAAQAHARAGVRVRRHRRPRDAPHRAARGEPSRRRRGGEDEVTVSERGKPATRAEVIAELRGAQRFLLVTPDPPGGAALGSVLAMHEVLGALGKDWVMFIAADESPLPYESRFSDFEGLVSSPPAALAERTVVFLDCGNIDRNPA